MKRLICSFSGGRTSGYMTYRVLEEWKDQYDEITVLFANTGLEHEKTLEFVHNCDKHFGFNTVWLEAITHMERGKGQTHRVVTFETASRNGEPYYDFVRKNGIPNVGAPKCTNALKENPLRSYIRTELGHTKKDYDQCIGIRVDEIDRMTFSSSVTGKVLYPLVSWEIDKPFVLAWWAQQGFDLELSEHLGNCVTCFKKSDRKLMTIAKNNPEFFEPMQNMERDLGTCGPYYARTGEFPKFFRKNRTTADIIAVSKEPFEEFSEKPKQFSILDDLDISNGCVESCEVGVL